jgi:hypothetical protein
MAEADMTEDLLEFENTVEDEEGRSHVAVVLCEERDDGRWIGRVRFIPTDGSPPFETDRETTQPRREFVHYWATGLTYFYLEGALHRARRRAERAKAAGAAEPRPAAAPPMTEAGPTRVPHPEVSSLSPRVAEEVMGAREPGPGTTREVPAAGVVVYEGIGGSDGASHLFAVQFGSRNAGATLANWLWSRLHGLGVEVRVDGRVVELTNDALKRALVG